MVDLRCLNQACNRGAAETKHCFEYQAQMPPGESVVLFRGGSTEFWHYRVRLLERSKGGWSGTEQSSAEAVRHRAEALSCQYGSKNIQ